MEKWDVIFLQNLSNAFWFIFFSARIKLAIKEAEIQKLQANLTANQLSHNLTACDDYQEGRKLNSLEIEAVKLGNQLGMFSSFNKL